MEVSARLILNVPLHRRRSGGREKPRAGYQQKTGPCGIVRLPFVMRSEVNTTPLMFAIVKHYSLAVVAQNRNGAATARERLRNYL